MILTPMATEPRTEKMISLEIPMKIPTPTEAEPETIPTLTMMTMEFLTK